MRCVLYLAVIPLLCGLNAADSSSSIELRSTAVSANAIAPIQLLTKEVRRERRKERRMLRKKKQRMRELREEIRILTMSLQQANSTTLFEKGGIKLKHKEKQGRKGVKWRKNLLEKLKGIMRRLDRMERRIVEGTHISPSEFLSPANDYGPSNATTTPKPSTNETIDQKLKRIQPAISRSRSGENGTACSAHKDCRPGHCCHRLMKKDDITKSVCVLHRLMEKEACVDGCQCSSHLNCFLPDTVESQNATAAFCKKAASSDILAGSYLYKKDSVIVDSGST